MSRCYYSSHDESLCTPDTFSIPKQTSSPELEFLPDITGPGLWSYGAIGYEDAGRSGYRVPTGIDTAENAVVNSASLCPRLEHQTQHFPTPEFSRTPFSSISADPRLFDGEKLRSCKECGTEFSCSYSLEQHALTHEHRAYVCSKENCGKSYCRRDLYTRHKKVHQTEMHACNESGCEKKFKRKDHLRQHIRSKHDLDRRKQEMHFKGARKKSPGYGPIGVCKGKRPDGPNVGLGELGLELHGLIRTVQRVEACLATGDPADFFTAGA